MLRGQYSLSYSDSLLKVSHNDRVPADFEHAGVFERSNQRETSECDAADWLIDWLS